jgi:hypothetical protein
MNIEREGLLMMELEKNQKKKKNMNGTLKETKTNTKEKHNKHGKKPRPSCKKNKMSMERANKVDIKKNDIKKLVKMLLTFVTMGSCIINLPSLIGSY